MLTLIVGFPSKPKSICSLQLGHLARFLWARIATFRPGLGPCGVLCKSCLQHPTSMSFGTTKQAVHGKAKRAMVPWKITTRPTAAFQKGARTKTNPRHLCWLIRTRKLVVWTVPQHKAKPPGKAQNEAARRHSRPKRGQETVDARLVSGKFCYPRGGKKATCPPATPNMAVK